MSTPHSFVSTQKELLDLDIIYRFLSTCYWSPGIARSRLERGIANSLCFGVYEQAEPGLQPRQAGFARVVTDLATYAYICDVFVLDEFRGRGYSKMLMRAIKDHPDLRGVRRLCLMTRDAHGLYAQFGFAAMPDPSRYMEVTDRESYKQD